MAGDSAKSEYLEECGSDTMAFSAGSLTDFLRAVYRVNWLRARSRFDRWREEYKLLRSEMDWILNFFSYKEAECKSWALRKEDSPGHVACPEAGRYVASALRTGRQGLSKDVGFSQGGKIALVATLDVR